MLLIVRWSLSMMLLLVMMILRMSMIGFHQWNLHGVLGTGSREGMAVCLLLLSMLRLGVRTSMTLRTSISSHGLDVSRCKCAVLSWLEDLWHRRLLSMLNDVWL
jgi:hypothetical protein